MRQVVLDTETTGLEVSRGHRIIEIGCVEIINRRRTGRTYHVYVDPQRDIDEAAQEVHGISRESLAGKPVFAEIRADFLEFVGDSELIIHNAEFDLGFINKEISLAGGNMLLQDCCEVIDTLALARQMHPGQRNSLDALCKRYHVDSSRRDLHGALLDAQLLADVYLAMTGGQASLSLGSEPSVRQASVVEQDRVERSGLDLHVRYASPDELDAHESSLAVLDKACPSGALWRRSGE